jgi:hypothetical protein
MPVITAGPMPSRAAGRYTVVWTAVMFLVAWVAAAAALPNA